MPAVHKTKTIASSVRYGFPAKKMRIIGVTGTNGKTTTSYMIYTMLHSAGIRVGIISTALVGAGDDVRPQEAHVTTASGPALQKQLKDMLEAGVDWVVLETTSHALAQYRVWGVPFEIAVLTNVTHEHLDYHKTFERYTEAKQRLFAITARCPNGYGIINADDPQASAFEKIIPHTLTYGVQSGDMRATAIASDSKQTKYTATVAGEEYTVTCHLLGEFNVYNSLAAIAAGRRLGLTRQQIEDGIEATKLVPGRMMHVDAGQSFSIIIDFAHTPDAFERLLSSVRRTAKGKVIAVFGSAGRRDESKRSLQGEIAARYCDELILTEEDDRDCDGLAILKQIEQGALKSGSVRDETLFVRHDRTEAIHFAMSRVDCDDDIVLLLGKGHERTIERADGEHAWDEIAIAKQAVQNLKNK